MPFNFKGLASSEFYDTKMWHDTCDLLMQEEELKQAMEFLDKKFGENGKVSMYEILYRIVFQFDKNH